jgi:agmatinase
MMLLPVEPRIIRVPYEEGAFWRKGTKDGPDAVLREFFKLREFSLMAGRRLSHKRAEFEFPAPPIQPYSKIQSLRQIEESIQSLLASGHAPVVLGGDHSITLPVVRALASVYGRQSFGVLHIDAHSDTFDPVDGFKYHHGAVFRNIVEEGLVCPSDIHQFGIRGLIRGDGLSFADQNGICYVLMQHFRAADCRIAAFCPASEKPYYLSIDIDAIDPAFAPGTGIPVPGGLTSAEMLSVVNQIREYRIIGMDLVEVAPTYDISNITVLLAAHIIFESLVGISFVQIKEGRPSC